MLSVFVCSLYCLCLCPPPLPRLPPFTSMSIIDINGILSFFDLDTRRPDPANAGKTIVGEHLSYERKVRCVGVRCVATRGTCSEARLCCVGRGWLW